MEDNLDFDFSEFEGLEDLKPLEETIDEKKEEEKTDKKEELEDAPLDEKAHINPPSEDIKKDKQETSSSNIFLNIANVLQDGGFLTLEENEKIEKAEDLVNLVQKIQETALETEQSDWSDYQKEYFEAIRNGIPHEQVVQHQQTQQVYSNITDDVLESEEEDSVNLRKQIIIAGFKARGFDDKKALRYAEQSVKEGTDIDDAKDFRDELKDADDKIFKEKLKEQEERNKETSKKIEEQRRNFKEFLNVTKEIIPGMPITPKEKKLMNEGVTKAYYTDEKTGQQYNRLGDYIRREGQQGLAKLIYILEKTEDFKKADILSSSKAKKSIVKEIEDAVRTTSSVEFSKDDSGGKLLDNLLTNPAFQ